MNIYLKRDTVESWR